MVTAIDALRGEWYTQTFVGPQRRPESEPTRVPGALLPRNGWLVGFVIDTERKTTDFVILDARNFTGAPQATITIPVQIPPGFHGNFIPLA